MAAKCLLHPKKRRFHDEKQAKEALKRIKTSLIDSREKTPARVYHCDPYDDVDACNGFHLTSLER